MAKRRRKKRSLGAMFLPKFVGKVKCERWGDLKLCVIGHKYGFEGRLYAKSLTSGKINRRKWLPVSTGDAIHPGAALENARRFLTKVRGRNN